MKGVIASRDHYGQFVTTLASSSPSISSKSILYARHHHIFSGKFWQSLKLRRQQSLICHRLLLPPQLGLVGEGEAPEDDEVEDKKRGHSSVE